MRSHYVVADQLAKCDTVCLSSGQGTASRRLNSQEVGRSSVVLRLQWSGLVVPKRRSRPESLEFVRSFRTFSAAWRRRRSSRGRVKDICGTRQSDPSKAGHRRFSTPVTKDPWFHKASRPRPVNGCGFSYLTLFDAPDKSRDQPNRSLMFAQKRGSVSDSATFVAGVLFGCFPVDLPFPRVHNYSYGCKIKMPISSGDWSAPAKCTSRSRCSRGSGHFQPAEPCSRRPDFVRLPLPFLHSRGRRPEAEGVRTPSGSSEIYPARDAERLLRAF